MSIGIILVLIAGINSTIGNLLLKYSRITTAEETSWMLKLLSPYFVGAIFFYVINLVIFAKALDYLPVSVGYPILASSGFALLSVASFLIFKETFGIWQISGLIAITIGMILIAHDV
ncbi:MAG: QacE family quaternary ammonium compound efflux SMR transporter [Rickettsiales bacterium]|jgi:multidrug transporter EmrE-like cation transporter|nr:QacE family quaternary ammonium compound efflux SMR transporter [Rickettsiales bacterium]